MTDYGAEYTDRELEKMEKKIQKVYAEAQKDIQKKLDDFDKRFEAKNKIYLEKLDKGEITNEQYSHWLDGQIFQQEQWESKKKQIIKIIQNANKEASNIINGGTINAFAENANWSHYEMEHTEGINFGFGLYDAHAVTNLIKNDPQVLPKWKVNEKKDYVWNSKKVDNAITQGIIQGERLDQITDRLANSLSAQNRNTMLTFARTAMTGAQNAGRFQGLMDAKELDIDVVKVWMATLDDHTRVSHREIDGEEQKVGDKWHPFKFSNGCRYPGDPLGPAHEVYNCRCTLVSEIKDYPSKFNRYDNIEGKPIKDMSYNEWLLARIVGKDTTPHEFAEPASMKPASVLTPREKSYIDNLSSIVIKGYKKDQIDDTLNGVAYKLGVDADEAQRRVNNGLTKIIDECDFTMRIRSDNFEKVLKDGYFKNQFETGTSGGAFSPNLRKDVENKLFNVPVNNSVEMSDADRPVYGMFCPKYNDSDERIKRYYNEGPGSWYGDGITVVLDKNKVFNNATMTIGDSLDYKRSVAGMEVNNIQFGGTFLAGSYGNIDAYWMAKVAELDESSTTERVNELMMDISEKRSDSYFEYQLHGKESHSVENVERVIIDKRLIDRGKVDDLINELKTRGIPYTVNDYE